MPCYTYILYSKSLEKFYTGSSSLTPEKRLQYHLYNHKGFTSKSKDWQIVYTEEHASIHDAIMRERQIKSWKSSKQILKLLNPFKISKM